MGLNIFILPWQLTWPLDYEKEDLSNLKKIYKKIIQLLWKHTNGYVNKVLKKYWILVWGQDHKKFAAWVIT